MSILPLPPPYPTLPTTRPFFTRRPPLSYPTIRPYPPRIYRALHLTLPSPTPTPTPTAAAWWNLVNWDFANENFAHC